MTILVTDVLMTSLMASFLFLLLEKRIRWIVCPVLIYFLGLSPAAHGSPGDSNRRNSNILLITVDTLRADRLKCYGYSGASTPVMDQLAAHGFRFERAYSQVPLTLPSHYSILSGTYPLSHGVHDNSQSSNGQPTLISEILQRNGYRTGAFVGSFILDSRFGLDRGFDVYGDNFDVARAGGGDLSHIERPAAEVVRKAWQWITEGKGKFFAWGPPI